MASLQPYDPAERSEVEILVDGAWYAAELQAWSCRGDVWWGNVLWRTGPGQQYVSTVPADRIRQVEVPAPLGPHGPSRAHLVWKPET